jgi:hypothetical protein
VQKKPCNLLSSTTNEDALTEAEIASMFAEAKALDEFFSGCSRAFHLHRREQLTERHYQTDQRASSKGRR